MQLDAVSTAYIKPGAEPALLMDDILPRTEEPPATTPNYAARQGYLSAAPGGVDAHYAWTKPGGAGEGIRIIDIEGAWRFTHEDLRLGQGGVAGGTSSDQLGWRNHGTAVIGEFSGDLNSYGINGICPEANVRGISVFGAGWGSASAIRHAADLLNSGDVILIELHRPGPRFNFAGRQDQRGYIALEWWPDDYDAIRYAIGRGVIVVEAAGNGAENLDDDIYDTPAGYFPSGWSNPFRRGARDSGAILVGAGAPPQGTHGRDHGPDRSRLDFSNFGAAVDAQGWGREVTTTGYGDLQGGINEDVWYTDQFSGTSSASPIVVGALASVQGFLRAKGLTSLTPATARNLLRTTGSPQQDGPNGPATQRIGNRPDIRQMIDSLDVTPTAVVSLYRYWNPSAGDHFYTTRYVELGSGRYGWMLEGVQCQVHEQQLQNSVPLYRYWNPGIGDHFYTTRWAELGSGRYGWGYEGIQCYVFQTMVAGTVPLHRYWNPSIGDHFYTTNWSELGSGRHGWYHEGIQCYVYPAAASDTTGAPGTGERSTMQGTPSTPATSAVGTDSPAPVVGGVSVGSFGSSFGTEHTPRPSFSFTPGLNQPTASNWGATPDMEQAPGSFGTGMMQDQAPASFSSIAGQQLEPGSSFRTTDQQEPSATSEVSGLQVNFYVKK
jgi:hypothetical protein